MDRSPQVVIEDVRRRVLPALTVENLAALLQEKPIRRIMVPICY